MLPGGEHMFTVARRMVPSAAYNLSSTCNTSPHPRREAAADATTADPAATAAAGAAAGMVTPTQPTLLPVLPYGGDMQAAMAAQDRPAIKLIMQMRKDRIRREHKDMDTGLVDFAGDGGGAGGGGGGGGAGSGSGVSSGMSDTGDKAGAGNRVAAPPATPAAAYHVTGLDLVEFGATEEPPLPYRPLKTARAIRSMSMPASSSSSSSSSSLSGTNMKI